MHSGNVAAMPPARNDATFSFCQVSRSVRITTAILVSNCMDDSSETASFRDAPSGADLRCAIAHLRFAAARRPGMTIVENLPLGVAGPGADHAFLAAELIALAGRLVERTRNPRLDRITVGTAGIGHVNHQRGTGAFHGQRGAIALALLAGRGPRRLLARIVVGSAVGAALADRECSGRQRLCCET